MYIFAVKLKKFHNSTSKQWEYFPTHDLCSQSSQLQVPDQDLDVWPNSSACVPDALRRYYYQYLSSTTEAAEVSNSTILKLVLLKCSLMHCILMYNLTQ
jgi:hypothetical protein